MSLCMIRRDHSCQGNQRFSTLQWNLSEIADNNADMKDAPMQPNREFRCLILATLAVIVGVPSTPALAGAPPDWEPGVEGQWGAGASVWSPAGDALAVTRWDHAALLVVSPQSGGVVEVSRERGAGFAPVWAGGRLLFKEVVEVDDGARQHRIVLADPWTAERWLLDSGDRLGEPSISSTGLVVWSHGEHAVVRQMTNGTDWPVLHRLPLTGYSNLVVFDAAGERLAFNHPDGSIGVLHLSSGEVRWLTGAGAWSHPSWSDDGTRLLLRAPGDGFVVLDSHSGEELAAAYGTHPRWIPGPPQILFERIVREPYRVLGSDLFILDLGTDSLWPATAGFRHERHGAVSADGGWLAFVDTRCGDLFVAQLDPHGLAGEPTMVLRGEELPWSPPPPSL